VLTSSLKAVGRQLIKPPLIKPLKIRERLGSITMA
jgi:hypothetical protein